MAPIVKTLPSYIKDSQHALQIFRDFNFLGQDKLIFTMDITCLYIVLPNGEGLLAFKHLFDQRTVKEPKYETLLRLAALVLTLSCFSFGDNFFKQTNGVSLVFTTVHYRKSVSNIRRRSKMLIKIAFLTENFLTKHTCQQYVIASTQSCQFL